MANLDAAFGLRPYKILGAGANTNGVMSFDIQTSATAGTSSTIYEGTPVIPLANGMIDIVGAAAGGTVPILGAFIGCQYTDLNGKPVFTNKWPGTSSVKSSTAATALVAAHPATSGDSTTGKSSAELAISTANTTNTLNMRIIGFEDTPSSDDATAAGRLAIVQLNNHFYRYNANGTGAGV